VKITVIGAYGCGNVGDDAILAGILEKLKKVKVSLYNVAVFSGNKKYIEEKFGVRGVQQCLNQGFSLKVLGKFDFLKMIKTIWKSDMVIIGGGSLLHDLRPYNLPYFFFWQLFSSLLGKKVIFYGVGVGPIKTRFGKLLSKIFLPRADYISVRDTNGQKILRELGIDISFLSRDPAFNIEVENLSKPKYCLTNDAFGITICGWFKSSNFWERKSMDFSHYIIRMAEICDRIIERYNKDVLFVTTVFPHDLDAARKITKQMKHSSRTHIIEKLHTPVEVLAIIQNHVKYLVGMRLHSLIFATMTNTPFTAIIYDQKVRSYLNDLGCKVDAVELDDIFGRKIFENIEKLVHNEELMRKHLQDALARVKKVVSDEKIG
jgi:Uncharacterized conserved protein